MSHFSFSLSHTPTMFLFISSHGLHLSKWLNISLCFALSGTHTHWPNMALCFFCFNTPQGRIAFASFFSFFSLQLVSHTCSVFALNQKLTLEHFPLRSQNFPYIWSYLNKWKAELKALGTKLINEL